MQEDKSTPPATPRANAPNPRPELFERATYQSDDVISLAEILRVINSQRRLILATTVACTVLAAILALVMTPVYRSKALLIPAVQEQESQGLSALANQFGGLAGLAGLTVGGRSSKDEAIALLKSRDFTAQVIQTENLMPLLFADQWDAESGSWKSADPDKIPTLNDAYRLFDREIRQVTEDRKTGLVTLTIDWNDRELAARWAQLLVERVNQRMRERAIEEAERSLEYLNLERQKTAIAEVQQAIYRLIENQVKTIMLANVRDQYAFRVIDPPAVADQDDPVRPKRALMIVVGFVLGGLVSLFVAFIRNAVQSGKTRSN